MSFSMRPRREGPSGCRASPQRGATGAGGPLDGKPGTDRGEVQFGTPRRLRFAGADDVEAMQMTKKGDNITDVRANCVW